VCTLEWSLQREVVSEGASLSQSLWETVCFNVIFHLLHCRFVISCWINKSTADVSESALWRKKWKDNEQSVRSERLLERKFSYRSVFCCCWILWTRRKNKKIVSVEYKNKSQPRRRQVKNSLSKFLNTINHGTRIKSNANVQIRMWILRESSSRWLMFSLF
jgi:hypothetical protein